MEERSTGARAADRLDGIAKRVREADADYKGSDKLYADLMALLFPTGIELLTSRDHQRFHLFMLAMVKVTRYARNWNKGHDDSLTDLAAYAAMLQVIDREPGDRKVERSSGFTVSGGRSIPHGGSGAG